MLDGLQYPSSGADPVVTDIAQLRRALLAFARARLRNPAMAEDAVSDTVLAFLEGAASATGAVHGRAWVYGVLRHKIVDQLRRQHRELASGDMGTDADHAQAAWSCSASMGSDPEALLHRRQLATRLANACQHLPPAQRQAFLMREVLDWASADICRQLAVTEGHLWVLVHRARQKLQGLLQEDLPARRGAAGSSAPIKSTRPHRVGVGRTCSHCPTP